MDTATQTLPKYVKYKIPAIAEASPYNLAPKGSSNKGEGNPAAGQPRIINPGDQNIPNTCTIKGRNLRYIKGVPTLDLQEQIKMGYTLKHQLTSADAIKLERGELVMFPGENPVLYEYLETCPYNQDSPNRTTQSTILFYKDNAQKKADELNEERRLRVKAMNIVERVSDDTTQLTKMAAVLGLDTNQIASTLINELGVRAEHTPKMIIDAFGSDEGDVAELVYHAVELNVIHFTGFAWNLSEAGDGEGKIMGMKGRQDEGAARKKLIAYLQSAEGELHRTTIQKMVKAKKYD